MCIYNPEELNLIINSLSDGIYLADANGTFVAINDIAAELEGIDPTEYLGKNAFALVEHGILKKNEVITLKVLEQKTPVHQYKESHNNRKIMVTGIPIFKEGELFRILIQERDITGITKLQQRLNELTKLKSKIEDELSVMTMVKNGTAGIVYRSKEIKYILQTCTRIANVDTTVLITGESGTGKGVFARYIHSCSSRNNHKFIKIDCTSIPENLFESELFGYEPGSFTGAHKGGKSGLIELADEGTLFIDEIGELSLSLQTKLLSVIQEKQFYRVGGKRPIHVDIRIIAATNRNLEQMMETGLFREDLYYRLNVVPIIVPPLRERIDDIYPLCIHFLDSFNKKYNLHKRFSSEIFDFFVHYCWKGNVRELENTIERLVVTAESELIRSDALPSHIRNYIQTVHQNINYPQQSYAASFADFEKKLLSNVLNHCNSTKEMSDILKIAPNTITTKLKKYGIKIPYKKGPKKR